MDISLAGCAGNANRRIFQHAAIATHGMALEMGQVDHPVIIGQVVAHNVILDVGTVLNGNAHLAVLVHDVHGKDGIKAVLMNGLPMLRHILTGTAISSAALNDCAIHLFHQVADQCGFEVMVVTTFASADFHRHAACCLNSQGFVDFH